MRFLGNIEAKLDAKGRVFLPAVFRKQLEIAGEKDLTLRTDISGKCLKLYPMSAWIQQLDAIQAQVSPFDEDEVMVLREFMSKADMFSLDSSGRFLIAKRFLQDAGINQAVRFIGMNDTIEIWAAEKAEQPFLPQGEFASRLKALMKKPPRE